MKKYNVIVVFDKDLKQTLMCKRTKEPYKDMFNLVGGKIEKENDGLSEAYRELYEEKIIDLEIYTEMEKSLLGRMTKINNEYKSKRAITK